MLGRGKSVLIVGDDPDVRRALAASVAGLGARAIEARDAVEALDRLRHDARPAAILLDLWTPPADRAVLLEALRDDPRLSSIPVMTLTGRADSRPGDARSRDRAFDVDEVARILVSACDG